MNKPIEKTLNDLIPRHSGPLPPELIELASSLLAQSKNKASNLKAEEEIGRTYACANIACERLKSSLNLPPIEPRPPVPPRIYKRLYAHLDGNLTSTTPRKRTKSNNHNQSTPKSNPRTKIQASQHTSLPQRHTPSKEASFASFRNGNRQERAGIRYGGKQELGDRVPKWVAPVVRKLCRETETRSAIPHVLTGVESVLCHTPPEFASKDKNGKLEKGKRIEGRLPALVAAVWFWATQKLLGKDTVAAEITERTKTVLRVFAGVRADEAVVSKVGDTNADWLGWEETSDEDVGAVILELFEKGWCSGMEWFENIEEVVEIDGYNDDGENGEEVVSSSFSKHELRRAGLGSMKLEKYEYLDEKKQRHYEKWKAIMIKEIERLVAEGILDEGMES